jgi:hypothetical protein
MGTFCELHREQEDESSHQSGQLEEDEVTVTVKESDLNEFREPLSLCQPNPCHNDAKCKLINKNNFTTFECECKSDNQSGQYCELVIKEVPLECPLKCNNRGRCIPPSLSSSNKKPKCLCDKEFDGSDCSQINYCIHNLCQNNSTCLNYPDMRSYLCVCKGDFIGQLCHLRPKNQTKNKKKRSLKNDERANQIANNIDNEKGNNEFNIEDLIQDNIIKGNEVTGEGSASESLCLSQECHNNGTCVIEYLEQFERFSFVCKCQNGFQGNLCEIEVNVCTLNTNPCPIGMKCRPLSLEKYLKKRLT